MSINALPLALGIREYDSHWRRLYWTLPLALSIWMVVLAAFAYFTRHPIEPIPEPTAVEARLIEIPPPAPIIKTPIEEKKPASPPIKPVSPSKPQMTLATPPVKLEQNPSPIREERSNVEPSRAAVPASPKVPASTVREESSTTGTNLAGTNGAQAIVRPMPQIPEELRQDALSASAVARFHVAADGTATVELAKPTPNPRINRLLLDTLKNWRFFPAIKDGKPVVSIEEIVIKIDVK